MSKDWIQTFTGRKFFPMNPQPSDIDIFDIAHSLSNLCRFNGHTKRFYSVAEHCVLMAVWFKRAGRYDLARHALLHDASEAYLSDLPSPLKHLPEFAFYREAEAKLESMIYVKYGLAPELPAEVKEADRWILETEATELMSPLHVEWEIGDTALNVAIECVPWYEAGLRFIRTFDVLFTANK